MKSLFRKFFLLVLLAVSLATVAAWSETGRRVARKALSPIVWAASHIQLHPWQALGNFFSSRQTLRFENQALRQKLQSHEQEQVGAREIAKENERLRSLLRFQQEVKYQTVPARVVGRDPMQWFRGITIDKGSLDGVKLNMPVVTAEGLVGKIVDLSSSQAQVRLIVDFGSRVGSILQECREVGVLSGEGTRGCRLNYISRHGAVEKGERVLTSGVGSLYPKGLVIGAVEEVNLEKGGLYQTARVDPAVDFGKLEEVLVLVSTE